MTVSSSLVWRRIFAGQAATMMIIMFRDELRPIDRTHGSLQPEMKRTAKKIVFGELRKLPGQVETVAEA